MGEVADMMLEGILCAGCGEYTGEDSGYPVYCSTCAIDWGECTTTTKSGKPIDRFSKTNCPHCNKLVKKVGLEQHIKDKHNPKSKNE